jgi:uracil-DNA glycosylase
MRLFDDGDTPIPGKLLSSQTFKTGVLNLVYGLPSRPPTPPMRMPRPTCPDPTPSRRNSCSWWLELRGAIDLHDVTGGVGEVAESAYTRILPKPQKQ